MSEPASPFKVTSAIRERTDGDLSLVEGNSEWKLKKFFVKILIVVLLQYQVLAYADDVNLIGDNIRKIERNADLLLNACKDIGLAVNTGKTKYMEIRNRGVIANEHIKIGRNS